MLYTSGITATLSALINGHYDVAGLLIEKGADLNIADRTERTPLYSAVDAHTDARIKPAVAERDR